MLVLRMLVLLLLMLLLMPVRFASEPRTSPFVFYGGASRTPVAEGGGALWKARRSISPREKSGEKSSVGSAPRGVSALECALQVAIVVVRERSHLERVGDRCGSPAFRLSQRNSTHMLGASPLTA